MSMALWLMKKISTLLDKSHWMLESVSRRTFYMFESLKTASYYRSLNRWVKLTRNFSK